MAQWCSYRDLSGLRWLRRFGSGRVPVAFRRSHIEKGCWGWVSACDNGVICVDTTLCRAALFKQLLRQGPGEHTGQAML